MDIVFSKKWFEKHQQKLLWLLNIPIIKIWFRWCLRIDCEETINEITPNSYTFGGKIVEDKIELKTDFRTHDKYSKRLYFAFKPLWYLFHVIDWSLFDRYEELTKLSFGFSTLTQYPGSIGTGNPLDGFVARTSVNQTLTDLRAGAGTYADNSSADIPFGSLECSATSNQFAALKRSLVFFDTSALTSGATISAAILSVNSKGKYSGGGTAPDAHIAQGNATATNALQNSDYTQTNHGTTSFGSVAYASWPADGTYADFTLNASGISAISKTGISKFSGQLSWDIANSFGGTWANGRVWEIYCYTSKTALTTKDPKLVVTYTLPAGPANLKSYNTNVKANIKSINTNLIANVKSLNTNI